MTTTTPTREVLIQEAVDAFERQAISESAVAH